MEKVKDRTGADRTKLVLFWAGKYRVKHTAVSGGARDCLAIASALTAILNTVNGFSQVSKALVSVHAFRDALPCVP